MRTTQITLKKQPLFFGKVASLYLAGAYLAGIIIFIVVLRYPFITEAAEKVRIIVGMKSMVFTCYLIMYVLFGPVLVLFVLDLKSRMENSDSLLVRFSSVIGFIWAGSLTASGMITNATIAPLEKLLAENPELAVQIWQMLDAVTVGLGNGNGEILGGIMTLGFSIAIFRDKRFSKVHGIFGMVVGVLGILSLFPVLKDLMMLFGLLQLIWYVWTGFSKVSPTPSS